MKAKNMGFTGKEPHGVRTQAWPDTFPKPIREKDFYRTPPSEVSHVQPTPHQGYIYEGKVQPEPLERWKRLDFVSNVTTATPQRFVLIYRNEYGIPRQQEMDSDHAKSMCSAFGMDLPYWGEETELTGEISIIPKGGRRQ